MKRFAIALIAILHKFIYFQTYAKIVSLIQYQCNSLNSNTIYISQLKSNSMRLIDRLNQVLYERESSRNNGFYRRSSDYFTTKIEISIRIHKLQKKKRQKI